MARRRQSTLEKYCKSVISGKTIACKKTISVCKRLLNDIHHPYKKWHFDQDRAEYACRFIEGFCYIPSGKIGKPFILEDYEAAWVQSIFGFVDDDGNRRYQEVFINVARKNGKTSLCAAIEMLMLIADGEGAPQVYNVANSGKQAELGYNACKKMRSQSKLISSHVKQIAGPQLYCDINMGFIRPLCSNTSNLDGLDVHLAVLDEMAAMTNRDLYDLMKQAISAREQPLILIITTNGFVRNNIFDSIYDYASQWLEGDVEGDRFLAWVYELDDRSEWTREKCWKKANPGLGTVKSRDYLREQVKRAKDDPTYLPTVLTKDFDIPENNSVAWLSFDDAVNKAQYDFGEMGFKYGVCGFDASDTIDLTCAQMLMMKPDDDRIYERSMYWIPEDALYAMDETGSRKERDNVPYQLWLSRGLIRAVPGNKIDKRVLLEWLVELRDEEDLYTYAIGLDPWHIDDTTLRELEMFVGKANVFKIRQGAQTLSQPMKQLKVDYAANRIVDNHNPINEWCRMNVMVRADVNQNIQPDKKNLNPANRIDGFAAELDAYITLNAVMENYLSLC